VLRQYLGLQLAVACPGLWPVDPGLVTAECTLAARLAFCKLGGNINSRGREVRQLDLGYVESSLSLEKPERRAGPLAGDRAPDAPIRGAAGQSRRLFGLFKGPHWTLLGYDVERDAVPPRSGLHIHTVGCNGDIIDESGHMRDVYGVGRLGTRAPGRLRWGDCLVRRDGQAQKVPSGSRLQEGWA
jgi:hypothetical protein